MDLVLVGVSHKTAPVEVRERIAFDDRALPEALATMLGQLSCKEAFILSTCNRVELIVRPEDGCLNPQPLKDFLHSYHGLEPPCLEPFIYSYTKQDTVKHVFRVASSLDSMVIGESQILGQMKKAYSVAAKQGSAGLLINNLMHRAFHVAKRVRSETRVSSSAVSISYVAVELARKILGELEKRSILLIGAGKMGELAAKNLIRCGISQVFVTNRTPEKAAEMAARFNGTPVPFEQLHSQLVLTDIAIVSTGARDHVLSKQDMQRVVRERRYRPLFLIDISVPRNVEPAVNDIEEIFLYDIDDMNSVIDANIEERKKEAEAAEQIIEEEAEQYARRAASRNSGALIGALRQRIETICLEELERNRNALGPGEYERIERMLQTTAHRLAHPFIMQIKHPESSLERHYQDVELIKRLFDLDDKE